MNIILHIDMNSFFASVEQQANPRLRGKPVGITGGDRLNRTVLCTASIEAKVKGVKTGMQVWEAKRVCPEIIIVQSDHDKYLSVTCKFLNIFKDYTDKLEVFSIDEAFLEIKFKSEARISKHEINSNYQNILNLIKSVLNLENLNFDIVSDFGFRILDFVPAIVIAQEIKSRLKLEIGEVVTCSIGISYNKLLAKLAGSLKKPDGLVVIPDQKTAIQVLDTVELDDICGIGPRIKGRLFNLGVRDFKTLRQVPKECLLSSFKSYGEILYNMARGIDHTPIKPFYEREEVKSVGHRHTIDYDTSNPKEIKQILLELCELVAVRLRAKNLSSKTIHCWYRTGLNVHLEGVRTNIFQGDGMQKSLAHYTQDGLEIFKTAWEIFESIWDGEKIRMIGVSVSNLKPNKPANLSWLPDIKRQETILQAMDKINNKFGSFTIKRGSLLNSHNIERVPNPFLSDRRFKL